MSLTRTSANENNMSANFSLESLSKIDAKSIEGENIETSIMSSIDPGKKQALRKKQVNNSPDAKKPPRPGSIQQLESSLGGEYSSATNIVDRKTTIDASSHQVKSAYKKNNAIAIVKPPQRRNISNL